MFGPREIATESERNFQAPMSALELEQQKEKKKLIIVRAFARLIKLPNIFWGTQAPPQQANLEIKGEIILSKKRQMNHEDGAQLPRDSIVWKRKAASRHLIQSTQQRRFRNTQYSCRQLE